MKLHPATLQFLIAINEYNTRKYFATVKDLYQEIRTNLQNIVTELLEEAKSFHDWYEDVHPREYLFRIYRDARRLKEWDQIYKWNFGMSIAPWGKKSQLPAYYLHIQPWNESLFCAGIYRPDTKQLWNLRRYIAKHGDVYTKLINDKKIKKTFGGLEGTSLVKPPRWFSEEDKRIDLIKRKQHMLIVGISDKELLETDITVLIKKYMHLTRERMEFLYEWLEYMGK